MNKVLALVVLCVLGSGLCAQAAVSDIWIYRGFPADAGKWGTGGWAPIGVTLDGGPSNPFLPRPILSGTRLLFLGYENYWTGQDHPATTVTVFVDYVGGQQKQATFTIGSLTTDSTWTRTDGDPALVLGGTSLTADRIGTSMDPNGVPDIILRFSDTGGFQSGISFTDDPLLAGTTSVKAVHIIEIRQRVNELRTRSSLPAYPWSDPILFTGTTPVRAVHVAELRSALAEVYTAAGLTLPTYTDPVIVPGTTVVSVSHIAELRSAVAAVW